jgi:hypothetical protein
MSEGTVAFDKQFHTRFFESSLVFEQSASLTYTDLISNERTEHPSDDSCCQHDAYVETAFSSQRARRDQGRIPQDRQADSHSHDKHEKDDVLGPTHDCGAWVILSSDR